MATAHGQFIADLDWQPFKGSLLALERANEKSTASAASKWIKVDEAIDTSSMALDKFIAKELAASAKIQEDIRKEGDAIAQANAARMRFRQGILNERSARGGANPNVSLQEQFMPRAAGGGMVAGRASGNTATYRAGQVALQVQDIAVQMQMGASASRILVQQGTQLASIFGPKGAIYAGVAAITIATVEWLKGTKEIRGEIELMEKAVEQQQKNVLALAQGADEANREARDAVRRRVGGDDFADRMKREEEHAEKLRKIQEMGGGAQGKNKSNFIEAENRRFNEQEKLIEHRAEVERDANRKKEKEEMRGLDAKQKELEAEVKGETVQERVLRHMQEIAALQKAQVKSGGEMGWQKLQIEILEKVLAIKKEVAQADKEMDKSREAAAKAAYQAATTLRDHMLSVEKSITAEVNNRIKAIQGENAEKAKGISNQVQKELMTPEQKKAAASAERDQRRAERAYARRLIKAEEETIDPVTGAVISRKELSPKRKEEIRGNVMLANQESRGEITLSESAIQRLVTAIGALQPK
jgi:hypothetical protein